MTKSLKIVMAAAMLVSAAAVYAAPPQLLLMPDRAWAKEMGYGSLQGKQGKEKYIMNLPQCWDNVDYKNVSAQLKSLFQTYGFPILDAQASADSDDEDEMDDMAAADEMGTDMASNLADDLVTKLKPDITMNIYWNRHDVGFNYSINYILDAVDSYSNKSVATVTGTSQVVPRSQDLAGLLKVTANEKMGEFASALMNYFNDVQQNGREIKINCTVTSDAAGNFKSEFGGKTLATIISEWLADNTVNHQFSEAASSANKLRFNQVRIPLYQANGTTPMNARAFVEQLAQYLRRNYNIDCDGSGKNLGTGRLTIK